DGRTLATAADGVVRVWAVEPGVRAAGLAGTGGRFGSRGIFSRDGERLLTGRWLCDARGGAPIADLGHEGGAYLEGGPTQNPWRVLDGRRVCPEGGIQVWDARTGALLFARDGARDEFFVHWHLVAVSVDGARYAVTRAARWSGERLGDAEVRLVDLADGRERTRFAITAASSMDLSADGRRLLVGSRDGVARVWDAESGRLLATFAGHAPGHDVRGVAFLLDGRGAASGAVDDPLCVWALRTGAEYLRRPLGEHDARYVSSPGGEHRTWHPTPGEVAEVEAWAGLRPPRRWTAEP